MYFYNVYSHISDVVLQLLNFDLNNAKAVPLNDIDDDGLVNSIVCEVQYTSEVREVNYSKDGKLRTEQMRKALICDGSKTLKLTIWGILIEMIRESALIQFTGASTKVYNEELSISTNYSTRICYLSQSLDVHFDEKLCAAASEP